MLSIFLYLMIDCLISDLFLTNQAIICSLYGFCAANEHWVGPYIERRHDNQFLPVVFGNEHRSQSLYWLEYLARTHPEVTYIEHAGMHIMMCRKI